MSKNPLTCLTVVAIIYPSTNPSSDRFRKGSIYAAGHRYHVSGRGGQGRVIHIQKGHGWRTGTYENGTYISDFTRYFEDSEWAEP